VASASFCSGVFASTFLYVPSGYKSVGRCLDRRSCLSPEPGGRPLRLPLTVNVGETEAVLAFFFFFADVRRGAKADPVIVRVLLSRVALLVAELRRVLLGDTGEPGA